MRANVECWSSVICSEALCQSDPALRNRKVKNLQSSNELSPGDYFHTYILHKLSRTQHQQNILRKLQTEHITANIARPMRK